ncbi:hypothetical protein Pmani_020283 [Petrolisthes manimaculis]|uniref:Uncharacterized protein n=1 Tax=Petrolisthes manimaculis TaxID=1843537 RepID=A0AAE1PH51_9EUCA|nr:hypothetical protein Pmani_020283 [Petrolisthes manimaculis]
MSSVQSKRLRKQIVFEIGETIHSGPSLAAHEANKHEGVGCTPQTIFPGDSQKSVSQVDTLHYYHHQHHTRSQSRFSHKYTPCLSNLPVSEKCKEPITTLVIHGTVSPEDLVPSEIPVLPEACVSPEAPVPPEVPVLPEAIVPPETAVLFEAPVSPEALVPPVTILLVEAPVPSEAAVLLETPVPPALHSASSTTITEASDLGYLTPGVAGTQSDSITITTPAVAAQTPVVTVRKAIEPLNGFSHSVSSQLDLTAPQQKRKPEACVPAAPRRREDQTISAPNGRVAVIDIKKEPFDTTFIVPQEVKEDTVEGNSHLQKRGVKVEEASIPQPNTVETIASDVILNEATLPEVAQTEAALPELTETKLVAVKKVQVVKVEKIDAVDVEITPDLHCFFSPNHLASPALQTSLTKSTKQRKEMVRLIQEGDTKLNSFCHKRSSRASKRINSIDYEHHLLDLKPDPAAVSRGKGRCTRTRRASCRSDKSESEVSDSRSLADEFDMVDKTAKPGKPKNGEPLLDEAATHLSAKYNGDVNTELVNGVHKVKGRRVSRANSDESDCSSASRSNGNVEHNGDKVDFSVLLEISPADRKKFESKKAKIRRKTADWLLISETEQYYNEKEEIMRNKNKLDSDSESDESDDGTENQDSKSDCSDESEDMGNSSRCRSKGKGKQLRTIDDDSVPCMKRLKDGACLSRKQMRPIGSRKRKPRYDLTMLNDDDDDDDENFYGFPISTTIPQGSLGVRTSGSLHSRSRGRDGCKYSHDGASCSSSTGKGGRKRLSDAERFLRDNREYYHFQETPERLRRSSSTTGGEKDKSAMGRDDDCCDPESKEDPNTKEVPLTAKKPSVLIDTRRRVTRSAGAILEEPGGRERERGCVTRSSDKGEKEREACKSHHCDLRRRGCERKGNSETESRRRCDTDNGKSDSEESKRSSEGERKMGSEDSADSDIDERKESSSNDRFSGIGECSETIDKVGDTLENSISADSALHRLYFSFEGVPEQESWYQTYQRLIDGVSDNVFFCEEDPLKFILPYEMPKEYVRDFLCYKKGLLSKKKNDLADLVRKSPRCHPSTLALISDIIPTKRTRSVKPTRSTVVKVDEASSDGTSTPGAESTRTQPPETFETTEELAILALHIDHIMKSEIGVNSQLGECKESEESDLKKTPPKKRGKKKRLLAVSKPEKVVEVSTKETKLLDSPFAQEVDPVFVASLCDEMKDFLIPENILTREASEVMDDSFFCVCTDRASCDEFSSADDNTEASSECVSLCDSETIDGSIVSEPKRTRSAKKRRKNMTGWPKAQKRKRPVPSHTSDDNDSAIGWDDLEPKKQGSWKKHEFSLLEQQTTSERLAALAACDRRASPRKKASVLYMDTWPVRFRTQK